MDMSGEYRIPAPRQAVWEALNDPEVLKASIPGCEELEKEGDNTFAAKVRAKVGPVSARFNGKVNLLDLDPPNGYRIEGEGQGGAAGFAKGGATVTLAEDGTDTVLTYEANASVGGKLAQIGSRLIDGTARKMADDFFAKFSEIVAANAANSASAGAGAAAAATGASTVEEIQSTVEGAIDSAAETAGQVAEAAGAYANQAVEAASEYAEKAAEVAEDVAEKATETAEEVAEAADKASGGALTRLSRWLGLSKK